MTPAATQTAARFRQQDLGRHLRLTVPARLTPFELLELLELAIRAGAPVVAARAPGTTRATLPT
ncbi:hypothetical protein FHR38_001202 [Micromonospora polyrhachis]|uniref:Uncharacterized protein n=1 Tax=Micromonospora polyrhachis TaxID=1282883 RepID=A0A7W7WNF5_9ACTN|nr:hypothetical protein [Micromonospora polyrhachis]